MSESTTISAICGSKSSGEPVYESLLVNDLGDGLYRLVVSPGLIEGIARGDTIRLGEDDKCILVERGGNVAVEVYAPHEISNPLIKQFNDLGGLLDARAPGISVFSVSVKVGFPAIEKIMNEFIRENPTAEWCYGNVYDPDTGEQLWWWKASDV